VIAAAPAACHGEQPLSRVPTPELTLAELLDDPLVGLLMTRDGIARQTIELLFEAAANNPEWCDANPVGSMPPPAAIALSK
jgi:hypothetical protein